MDSKELSELLECSVCLESLDHTSKVLPCQHTFCKRCLLEIQSTRKELRCPECRILVEDDVEDLLPNILLVRILEGLNRKKPVISSSSEREASIKQKIPKEPCAKVLYDYEPKEQGDLALTKGDFVVLLRQVDENWYEGQVKGSQGFLPANYVEVINSLPCLDDSYDDPVAKAVYDFDEVQEDDVLTFKQGDIISVTRRVDENWCEGKIKDKCGIFPVNFVEFNSVAKAIIESLELTNSSNEEVLSQTSSSSMSTNQQPSAGAAAAAAPHPKPVRKSKILNRDKVPKRHTIHGLEEREECSNISRVPSRHSVEITSSERLEEAYGENSSSHAGNNPPPQVSIATTGKLARMPASTTVWGDLIDFHNCPRQENNGVAPASVNLQNHNEQNVSSTATSTNSSSGQSRPNSAEMGKELYIALYNYRPLKEDEMELKAGESYCVVEKCKDGWFKGLSLSTQKKGVFPGNYVRLASIHNLLTKSRNNSSSQAPLPSPRQHTRPVNNGTASRPHYCRSESAPDRQTRQNVHTESLVVNLGNNGEPVSSLDAAQNNIMTRPLLPPPPESKTGGFWKKLKPKKKERSRSPPPLPPPPPYTRDVPSGHTQVSMLSSRPIPGTTPPPPYSSQPPPLRQVSRQPVRPHQRQENVPPWERFRAIMPYPPQSDAELELRVGDIIYVSKKRQDGWYKGTLERNGKTGLFPGCFSEKF